MENGNEIDTPKMVYLFDQLDGRSAEKIAETLSGSNDKAFV